MWQTYCWALKRSLVLLISVMVRSTLTCEVPVKCAGQDGGDGGEEEEVMKAHPVCRLGGDCIPLLPSTQGWSAVGSSVGAFICSVISRQYPAWSSGLFSGKETPTVIPLPEINKDMTENMEKRCSGLDHRWFKFALRCIRRGLYVVAQTSAMSCSAQLCTLAMSVLPCRGDSILHSGGCDIKMWFHRDTWRKNPNVSKMVQWPRLAKPWDW